ncbi:hypothetical protein [Pedobacter frigidisoli]|uniref:hypothetical protein n=1 Tax=Pedobacter frigidisoli TaxID=2530455 RepID=UPI00292FC056|nr:hypothetical protein [Pedobacter frigidisoli]
MKIQIEATTQQLNSLIQLLEPNSELADLKQQLITAIAMDNHEQMDDIPKPGDHPIIDRFE